jgi:hypothetical protein
MHFKPGDRVVVPWGLDGNVLGTVVEVWGDPPAHIRVELDSSGEASDEPVIVLLAPSTVAAA